MTEREPLAQKQARFLASYGKAKGASLSRFCAENPEWVIHTVQMWCRRDPDFKAAVSKVRDKVLKYGMVRPQKAKADDSVAETRMVERIVRVPVGAKVAAKEQEQAPLTEQQEKWLNAYEANQFDVIQACKAAEIPYREFEKMRVAEGLFRDRFDELERMKLQAMEDKFVQKCLADGDKGHLMAILKALKSSLVLPNNGDDSGGLNLLTMGMDDTRRKWRDYLKVETVTQQAAETLEN